MTQRSPIRGIWCKIVNHDAVPLSFRDAQIQQISVEGVLRLQPQVPNVNLRNSVCILLGVLCVLRCHCRHSTAVLLVLQDLFFSLLWMYGLTVNRQTALEQDDCLSHSKQSNSLKASAKFLLTTNIFFCFFVDTMYSFRALLLHPVSYSDFTHSMLFRSHSIPTETFCHQYLNQR